MSVVACALPALAPAASFVALDSQWGTPSVLAMSADGSTVVGALPSAGSSFVWRSGAGLTRILPLNTSGYPLSQLWDVTPDGAIAVGTTDVPCCRGPSRLAATWTDASGWTTLATSPDIDDLPYRYSAWAISDDGRIIAGQHQPISSNQYTPVIWVDGVAHIPDGMPVGAHPRDMSADGSVIVGEYAPIGGGRDAFVWSEVTGFVDLTTAWTECCDAAWAVSADGTTVVGTFREAYGDHAFRWSSAGGLEPLAVPQGFSMSFAADVTGDGKIIVGSAFDTAWSAALWDDTHGMRLLQDVLTQDLHLDLDGWQLTGVGAVSRDGRFVAGQAVDPERRSVAYVADLSPVPAPPVGWMLWALAVAMARWAPRSRRLRHPRAFPGDRTRSRC